LKKETLKTICYLGAFPGLIYGIYGLIPSIIGQIIWLALIIGIKPINKAFLKNSSLIFFAVFINTSIAFLAYYRTINGEYINLIAVSWLLLFLLAAITINNKKVNSHKNS